MKHYITFGQTHSHKVGNAVLDKDCVAVIHCDSAEHGRELAFRLFGNQFCFEYAEDEFDHSSMKFFPRGFVEIRDITTAPSVCRLPND